MDKRVLDRDEYYRSEVRAINVLIFIIFLSGTAYLALFYSDFRHLKNNEYTSFRKDLSRFISQLYVRNEYKIPNSIDEIIDGSTSIERSDYPYYNEMFRMLHTENSHLRLKYIADSNTLIVYRVGFDGIDRELNEVVYDLDSLSFYDYLFAKRGDVVISWVKFLERMPKNTNH